MHVDEDDGDADDEDGDDDDKVVGFVDAEEEVTLICTLVPVLFVSVVMVRVGELVEAEEEEDEDEEEEDEEEAEEGEAAEVVIGMGVGRVNNQSQHCVTPPRESSKCL
jgi:hypothetical protein